jgi:hypothetical protein
MDILCICRIMCEIFHLTLVRDLNLRNTHGNRRYFNVPARLGLCKAMERGL